MQEEEKIGKPEKKVVEKKSTSKTKEIHNLALIFPERYFLNTRQISCNAFDLRRPFFSSFFKGKNILITSPS